jgi:hypothetical protein
MSNDEVLAMGLKMAEGIARLADLDNDGARGCFDEARAIIALHGDGSTWRPLAQHRHGWCAVRADTREPIKPAASRAACVEWVEAHDDGAGLYVARYYLCGATRLSGV